MKPNAIATLLAVSLGLGAVLRAQDVISAQAGMLNFTAGQVMLNGAPVEVRGTRFPQMKEGEVLATGEGRAEVLLNPGSFLRIGENSSFTLVSAALTSWRIELGTGSFVFEIAGVDSKTPPAIQWKQGTLTPLKRGVYRIDADPPAVRVYEGEILLQDGSQVVRAGKGRELAMAGVWSIRRFDAEMADSLDLWSERRASYLAQANLEAAMNAPRSLFERSSLGYGVWVFNPWLGMVTYLPFDGTYNSFYGYRFYSRAAAVDLMYSLRPTPPRLEPGGGGRVFDTPAPNYPTVAPTSAGTSGTIAAGSPASTSSAGASSAPISRQSGDASGRAR